MFVYLFGFCIIFFFLYEKTIERYYKKDIENEKLISHFANARIKLMKMLYMKEITSDSLYFNIMLRATSYSIRTIYYNKKKLSFEQLIYLEDLLDFFKNENLVTEFKNLNGEQKKLFAQTAYKLLELYFSADFVRKIIWSIYVLKLGIRIQKFFVNMFEKSNSVAVSYIKTFENSYSITKYAYT